MEGGGIGLRSPDIRLAFQLSCFREENFFESKDQPCQSAPIIRSGKELNIRPDVCFL
jgi:hypothetical protein